MSRILLGANYYPEAWDENLIDSDIKKMKEELEYRITKVRPAILEEVKFTRSFGDLSENFEYHAAKRERGWINPTYSASGAGLSM